MAEGILFNFAEGIIQSLGSLALKEIRLLCSVIDELNKLTDTVETIKAVLLDAEEKQAVNHEVGVWLQKLKYVVYDADDLLDGFSTECLLREMMGQDKMAKKVRIFFSKSNQLIYGLKMGLQINAIREKLDAINATNTKFHLERRDEEIGVGNRKRDETHSFVRAADVIGREDDKKAIIDFLVMDSNVKEDVSILPIVGIGGLGKTTLAQLVFNDEKIYTQFQLKMWVCVSDNFDVKKLVEKILESATKKKPENYTNDTLVHYLRKEIDGKKYLLVLDDVWNEDSKEWDKLKELLIGGGRGTRILVTTRSKKVADIIRTAESHILKGLDEDKSWSLFKKMAFINGEEPEDSEIVAIGKEIVKKCVGVPLSIRTIGRLLHLRNLETDYWSNFKKNELPKIKENEILPTLKLSYDQLPSYLKHCFADCSLFPKDYMIDKSQLINLWIAQGFIKLSDQNQCLEDVGHEYFMDLLWRSFFQEVKLDKWGNVREFKMHDLMHDLAVSVAGSLITTVDYEKKTIDEKTFHVSVVDSIGFSSLVRNSLSKTSRIRTLLLPGRFVDLTESTWDAIFKSLKFLRVLNLHSMQLKFVPNSICKLKHLRYLELSGNFRIKKLPDSITRLINLHALRLLLCKNLEELPREIKKLVNLRHLEIDLCKSLTYMPRGLGKLTNLQTLSNFVVHYSGSASGEIGGLSEPNGLNSLRGKLRITGLRNRKDVALDYKGANLKEKQHLQALYLSWRREENVSDDEMVSEGFQPHPNLKKLELNWFGCMRFPIRLLRLTNLVTFKLSS